MILNICDYGQIFQQSRRQARLARPTSPCTYLDASNTTSGSIRARKYSHNESLQGNHEQALPERLGDKYTVLEKLGSGSYGNVYLVRDDKQRLFAAKTIKRDLMVDMYEIAYKSESLALANLDHKHIVQMHESLPQVLLQSGDNYRSVHAIIMEYASGGCLEKKCEALRDQEARHVFRQLAQAVSHMHKNNMAHRDLKLDNAVVDGNGAVKLIDFQFAAPALTPETRALGTLAYMAPELLTAAEEPEAGHEYTPAQTDIFALGVMLFRLVTRQFPFYKANKNDHLYQHIVAGNSTLFWQAHEQACGSTFCQVSQGAKDLIFCMLSADP